MAGLPSQWRLGARLVAAHAGGEEEEGGHGRHCCRSSSSPAPPTRRRPAAALAWLCHALTPCGSRAACTGPGPACQGVKGGGYAWTLVRSSSPQPAAWVQQHGPAAAWRAAPRTSPYFSKMRRSSSGLRARGGGAWWRPGQTGAPPHVGGAWRRMARAHEPPSPSPAPPTRPNAACTTRAAPRPTSRAWAAAMRVPQLQHAPRAAPRTARRSAAGWSAHRRQAQQAQRKHPNPAHLQSSGMLRTSRDTRPLALRLMAAVPVAAAAAAAAVESAPALESALK